ncbi:Phosphatidylinositol N-acetylglucosaminyltransferase [Penicillium frequentans]|uniref:Phosphatidylinositol N-acetylglucosaminyltransferase n=1 Tax=Penicillium frequentans TaxID=3151616 RepID=A0AAD6CSV7_9EURO|nr:Phosphatidylinositol N-acetylglucosaminyltransferase [Penicillium glabrum]
MTPPPSSLSIPPPIPVDTHPNRGNPFEQDRIPDPNRLAPEDAYFAPSHSKARSAPGSYNETLPISSGGTLRPPAWDPDNYTDTETFLDHLQRNPRVRPYDFWPLVSDSTVIVQHVCSVVIFVCCFVGIVQDRVSPVSIVCWGSVGTAVGWILWDNWIWEEQTELSQLVNANLGDDGSSSSSGTSAVNPAPRDSHPSDPKISAIHGLGLTMSGNESKENSPNRNNDTNGNLDATSASRRESTSTSAMRNADDPDVDRPSLFSSRNQQRFSTVKSAFLIYFSLLGLSPILKSLTKSTASDSIWAMSCWLLIMNIFSFDYGSGEGAGATTKFPASLSTNAAVMASTVLASRLPSTTHVFSLMLFFHGSIRAVSYFPSPTQTEILDWSCDADARPGHHCWRRCRHDPEWWMGISHHWVCPRWHPYSTRNGRL